MAFKEKFTPEEWHTLQDAIFWVFKAVAGADNKIDKKETQALESVVSNSGKFFNDLAREVFMEVKKNFETIRSNFEKEPLSIEDGLKKVSNILIDKTTEEMGLNFKKTLIGIGVFIGHSSGSFFGSKLSDEEVTEVKRIGELLGVSVGDLEKPPNLQQIIQNLNV
jgi:hypothetical protein